MPTRLAFGRALISARRAFRSARGLAIARQFRDNPNWFPPFPDLCVRTLALIRAARAAVRPVVAELREVSEYRGARFAGRWHSFTAHEAAIDAANDLLHRYGPWSDDPGGTPPETVYLDIEREMERERIAAIRRFCPAPARLPAPSDPPKEQAMPGRPDPWPGATAIVALDELLTRLLDQLHTEMVARPADLPSVRERRAPADRLRVFAEERLRAVRECSAAGMALSEYAPALERAAGLMSALANFHAPPDPGRPAAEGWDGTPAGSPPHPDMLRQREQAEEKLVAFAGEYREVIQDRG